MLICNYSADFFMPHLPALRVVDRFVLLWQAGITQIFKENILCFYSVNSVLAHRSATLHETFCVVKLQHTGVAMIFLNVLIESLCLRPVRKQ